MKPKRIHNSDFKFQSGEFNTEKVLPKNELLPDAPGIVQAALDAGVQLAEEVHQVLVQVGEPSHHPVVAHLHNTPYHH